MEDDPKVLIMGEDVGKLGGVFRVTDGLQKDFGEDRVIDTPLAESGIIGTAIGLALRGYRPVCEIQFDGFVYPAYDQIVSQVAKMHFRSQGESDDADRDPHPVRRRHRRRRAPQREPGGAVRPYRRAQGGGAARTPADAYWMIQQAIASDDPVVFFEPKRRYWEKAERRRRPPHPRRCCTSRVVRAGHRRDARGVRADGEDVASRRRRAAEEGRSLEVIDLRSLSPLDIDTGARVGAADRPRGRRARGDASTSASAPSSPPAITEECFYSLEAPVLRVGGFDTPYPPSRVEEEYLPDLDRVLDAVDRALAFWGTAGA